ncbi:hypothetical protein [Streptomyces poonensis]|uniref:Uncharacterized protein n=1 Tax=Streptomyces poonensis TaxID=68255 RepID=A0A918PR39_9ACTN|nr:hypothetical protein [Streptomyces poonensis]GGZ20105.1 hypothetical protein GCM10010365_45480 [Streptomyces poonensis]
MRCTRSAPLPRKQPGAAKVRRRARAGIGTAVGLAVLPFAVGGITGWSPVCTALGLVVGYPALVLSGELCLERRRARHSLSRITARTLTGVRSVDLNSITSVRLWTTQSYGDMRRALLVRDVHGVQLGVTSAAGRRMVRRAIKRQVADESRPLPRVSRAARAYLGSGRPGCLAAHTVLVFLAEVVGTALYPCLLFWAGDVG